MGRGGGKILHTLNQSRYSTLVEKAALLQINPYLLLRQLHTCAHQINVYGTLKFIKVAINSDLLFLSKSQIFSKCTIKVKDSFDWHVSCALSELLRTRNPSI